jgi:hypothetical protein
MAHYRHSVEGEVNENSASKVDNKKAGKIRKINAEVALADFGGADEPLPSKAKERAST